MADEDGGADRRARRARASRICPSTSPTRSRFGEDRNIAFYEVLDAYGRCLRLGDLMWQHHFEFLLLGYGAYATFAELCKAHLPDIPDQHIAQMVAGIDVLLFRPDAELRRLAASCDRERGRRRLRRGPHARRDRRRARRQRRPAAPGCRSWRRSRTRGSTWRPATGSRTTTAAGSTTRASRTRRSSGYIAGPALGRAGRSARPRRSRASATGSPRSTARCCPRRCAARGDDLLGLSRTVFPYVEEHKFYCDYWFLTRWWNKVREFGALLARHGFLADQRGHLPADPPRGRERLDELVLTWATGGRPLGPMHWPPIVARRKELLAAARRSGPRRRRSGWRPRRSPIR